MNVQAPLLPEGGVLLHIGPHKTGTTALQGALRLARPRLRENGVIYPGPHRQHMFAALAVTGAPGLYGDPTMDLDHWERLVGQVRRNRGRRVVVSSEFFDHADDETASRIVSEFGKKRVHVVVTLRPLAKIMPSAWQQYVRNRLSAGYGDWLESMLRRPPYDEPTPTFWQRHHHDVLVERWVRVAGRKKVTVVVVDEEDRGMLTRTFEQMLGLPAGLLVPEAGWMNRSLTLGETELVRQLNIAFAGRGWSDAAYKRYVRLGIVRQLQAGRQPAPGESDIVTPRWALERAAEIGAAAAARIEASGATIVGDISTLGTPPPRRHPKRIPDAAPVLPVEAALEAALGAILVSGSDPAADEQPPFDPAGIRPGEGTGVSDDDDDE